MSSDGADEVDDRVGDDARGLMTVIQCGSRVAVVVEQGGRVSRRR